MTNREQMAAGLMIAMGLIAIWWVNTPPAPPGGEDPTDPQTEAPVSAAPAEPP